LDGTLWAPHAVVLPAFGRVFRQLQLPAPDETVLLDTLGYQNDQIWRRLLPKSSPEARELANRLMAKAELDLIREGVAKPFPGVAQTLQSLAQAGCSLYILSNCGPEYLRAVPDALGIGHLFTGRFCAGDFPGLTKAEILALQLPAITLPGAMVGDRWHDMEAGRLNGFLTIGCCFGVGNDQELQQADHLIHRFVDLLAVFGLAGEARVM
jgi:phosphoglycolate phosphatase-like HAD superfamily hydrolase